MDVDPGTGQPRHHGRLEELTAGAAIAPHDSRGAMTREGPRVGEHMGRRDGEIERQLGRDLAIREATDAVGAEEPPHAY
jgi:hypothetical protein